MDAISPSRFPVIRSVTPSRARQLSEPQLLALAWKHFFTRSTPAASITIPELLKMTRPPETFNGNIAAEILKKGQLARLFEGQGATQQKLLRKLAELAKGVFAQLDANRDGRVDLGELKRAADTKSTLKLEAGEAAGALRDPRVFNELAGKGPVGKDPVLTIAGLDAIIARTPVVPPPALQVLMWKSFDDLQKAADKRGFLLPMPTLISSADVAAAASQANGKYVLRDDRPDNLISYADLQAAASEANRQSTNPAVRQLAQLAATLLKSPEWLKTVAGQDGKISRAELTRAVASVVLKSFDALNVVPAGGGITAADLAALTNKRTKAYAAARQDTRDLAAALKEAKLLFAALAGGKDGVITRDALIAVIRPQPAPRMLQSIAQAARANFDKLDKSGNGSISMVELQYLLKELKPGPAVAKLAAEVEAQFSHLSSNGKHITRADLQKLSGPPPLPMGGAAM